MKTLYLIIVMMFICLISLSNKSKPKTMMQRMKVTKIAENSYLFTPIGNHLELNDSIKNQLEKNKEIFAIFNK